MKCFAFLLLVPAAAVVNLRKTDACASEDLKRRMQLQNKLAGDCEEMCKEVGAYPKGCTCPGFAQPDSTPGVMTWEELLPHMDNLVAWGKEQLKGWSSQAASALQKTAAIGALDVKACAALDLKHRAQVQNKLATACEDMCKEIGAYPKCECPGFAPPDATPGVMTWEELNEHMDNLVSWGLDMLKKAKSRAGSFIQNATKNATKNATTVKKSSKNATTVEKSSKNATTVKKGCTLSNSAGTMAQNQNTMVYEAAKFEGAGQVGVKEGSCPSAPVKDLCGECSHGGASDASEITCSAYPCCMNYCCGADCWQR